MASELELKAVVEDPARVREALVAAGARPVFRGLLRDTRLDAAGALTGRDQVLRLRRWIPDGGPERAELAWKGPTSVNPAGYKHREELEVGVADGSAALRLLAALGYTVTHAIDRAVEVYQLGATVARLEWYPRMDVLVEIEGPPEGIERMIAATGLPRAACTADALVAFTARFESRTGRPAVLAVADLAGEPPDWERR